MTENAKQSLLKTIPGVDHLLETAKTDRRFTDIPLSVIKRSTRDVVDKVRGDILENRETDTSEGALLSMISSRARRTQAHNLIPVVNATGVVLHTNLGRSLLCKEAVTNMTALSAAYSNLEYDIRNGKRGIRYTAVEGLLCEMTGAEAAMVVNNNAGAVLLSLNSLASGREVVVSRGELVEIGGSFRIPDVMTKSGGILKEVGTTNRTHLKDYENAVNENTALLLKVHTSNFKIEGFTNSVPVSELVSLAGKMNLPVMEDLGSGTFIDFRKWGLDFEPTAADAVQAGADVVTFSGDKLLGGPQAGIILGRKNIIDKIKTNPLTRALRIDKLTLSALESTLRLYRDEHAAVDKIPTLKMLTQPYETVRIKAAGLIEMLRKKSFPGVSFESADMYSRPGGGSFPSLTLPTCCVVIRCRQLSAAALEKRMRESRPPVICRIEDEGVIMDPRTLQEGDEEIILKTLEHILT